MQAAQEKGRALEAWAGPSSSSSPVPARRLTPPSRELSTWLLPAVGRWGGRWAVGAGDRDERLPGQSIRAGSSELRAILCRVRTKITTQLTEVKLCHIHSMDY